MKPRKTKRDSVRDGIYTILSAAIVFPWLIWMVIEHPNFPYIFTI